MLRPRPIEWETDSFPCPNCGEECLLNVTVDGFPEDAEEIECEDCDACLVQFVGIGHDGDLVVWLETLED